MTGNYSISTIVPLWNEIESLPSSLERIEAFLEDSFDDYEIIIVESGSTDGSAKACDRFAAAKSKVRVIHEDSPSGMGAALKLGFSKASKELVWAVMVDASYPLNVVFDALPLFDNVDAVIGSRSIDDRTWFRRLQSAMYNILAKRLLSIEEAHVNSEFKIYRRALIQTIDIESRGWIIDAEILFKMKNMGATYAEIQVPVVERRKGKSSINLLTPVKMTWELLQFWRTHQKRKN